MTGLLQVTVDPLRIHYLSSSSNVNDLALQNFLQLIKSEGVWHSNENYEYNYKDIKYQFNFTQSFIKRHRKEGKQGYKYEIYDSENTPIGKGGYGIVYPIVATIIHYDQGIAIIKPGKNKLVKIQDHSVKDQTNSVIQEYLNLLQAGHLCVKKPIFFQNSSGKKSYLIMNRAEGFSLENILNPMQNLELIDKIPQLTVSKRLELTLAILNAIKTQVFDRKLVHRDIKPGNIIVDLNQNPPKVTIIDYGFAMPQDQQDQRRLGTRAYRSPESFKLNPKYSSQSDVYSVGRVLSYLWGDNYKNYYIGKSKEFDYIKTKSTNAQLFSQPEIELFLEEADQERIKNCLKRTLEENPARRLNLEDTITLFSKINIEQYKNSETHTFNQSYQREFEAKLNPQLILIKKRLVLLRNKEQELRNRHCEEAANTISDLVTKITRNTEYLQENPTPSVLLRYRKYCLKEINSSKEILSVHRDVNWVLAEVATAIALLGVGYLVAVSLNYYITGRLGLFSQTNSDKLTDELKETILLDLSPVKKY